jgi:hypothetical protein
MENEYPVRMNPKDEKLSLRVSTSDRENAIAKLKTAFIEGRLDDMELDERVLGALKAKTFSDLEGIVGDLPAEAAVAQTAKKPDAKKIIFGYGSTVVRKGRWKVAGKLRPVVFKGHMVLDLRAAELSEHETVFDVFAYKGTLEAIVLPGVRVEADGLTYKGEWINEVGESGENNDAPIIRIRGIAYKSNIVVRRVGHTGNEPQIEQDKNRKNE